MNVEQICHFCFCHKSGCINFRKIHLEDLLELGSIALSTISLNHEIFIGVDHGKVPDRVGGAFHFVVADQPCIFLRCQIKFIDPQRTCGIAHNGFFQQGIDRGFVGVDCHAFKATRAANVGNGWRRDESATSSEARSREIGEETVCTQFNELLKFVDWVALVVCGKEEAFIPQGVGMYK